MKGQGPTWWLKRLVRMAGEKRLLLPWLCRKQAYTSQHDATRDIADEQGGNVI